MNTGQPLQSHIRFTRKNNTERYSLVRMRYVIIGAIAAMLAFPLAPVRADNDLMKRALEVLSSCSRRHSPTRLRR